MKQYCYMCSPPRSHHKNTGGDFENVCFHPFFWHQWHRKQLNIVFKEAAFCHKGGGSKPRNTLTINMMTTAWVPQMNLSFVQSLESFIWPFIPTVNSHSGGGGMKDSDEKRTKQASLPLRTFHCCIGSNDLMNTSLAD